MRIEPVDERDSRWEDRSPRFRVYVFEESGARREPDGTLSQGYATSTWDVTGADLIDTIRWAQDRAGDRGLFSIALVADGYDMYTERGLVWLVGMDYQDRPRDDRSREMQEQMLGRRGRMVVTPA
jgi:hypothetical protein